MKPATQKSTLLAFALIALINSRCLDSTDKASIEKQMKHNKHSGSNVIMTYSDFLTRLEKVSVGTPEDDVKTLLGTPATESDSLWIYNLTNTTGFPGIPGPLGTTVFTGVEITFKNGSVTDISKSWFDTTGPKPPQE